MITVLLYGHLGKRFGKEHKFAIQSPMEAIRALKANFPGFERYLIEHSAPGYRIFTGEESVPLQELHRRTSKTIKIIPVVIGAGGSGKTALNIVLGVVLTIYAPELAGFAFEGDTAIIAQGMIRGVGLSLIIGGISTLLFAPPSELPKEEPKNKGSYSFGGAVNTTAQGNPVPICYGRLRVGSQVISAGLSTEQIF